MANRFGIPTDVEQRLRARDTTCVYCGKFFATHSQMDMPTIEHLSELPPLMWRDGLTEEALAICCGSCNSSRGNKKLQDWFQTRYCQARERPIDASSVALPVRRFLARTQ
jgi:5-methylcytosine-specific restriction endonuclease McrA